MWALGPMCARGAASAGAHRALPRSRACDRGVVQQERPDIRSRRVGLVCLSACLSQNSSTMSKKTADKAPAENTSLTLGLQPKEGEIIMAVCHIYASFNDTFVHVTEIGRAHV